MQYLRGLPSCAEDLLVDAHLLVAHTLYQLLPSLRNPHRRRCQGNPFNGSQPALALHTHTASCSMCLMTPCLRKQGTYLLPIAEKYSLPFSSQH